MHQLVATSKIRDSLRVFIRVADLLEQGSDSVHGWRGVVMLHGEHLSIVVNDVCDGLRVGSGSVGQRMETELLIKEQSISEHLP